MALIGGATGWIKRMSHYRRAIQIASGTFIIIIGALLLTNTMNLILDLPKTVTFIDAFPPHAAAPTYFTAIAAGLLSFLSPVCS